MKKLMISTALAGVLALPALAQTADNPTFLDARAEGSVDASTLIGSRVYASANTVDADGFDGVQQDWTDIGEVNDVILSRDGSVDAVLVDVGGFLGIGERQVAVDMTALRFVSDNATDADDWFLVMRGDRALLETAPAWNGMDGATLAPAGATATTGMAETTAGDPNAEVPAANEAISGTATDPITRDGFVSADAAVLTAEELTGVVVMDANDANIGEVGDLVLTDDGQVSHLIVDVGGFLGLGERPVAIEMSQVQILQADGGTELRVYLPMSRDQVEALPNAAEG